MTTREHAADAALNDTVADQARTWVRLLKSGKATTADAAALALWRQADPANEQAFEQAKRDWQELGEGIQAYRARHPKREAAVRQPARRWFLVGSAAAAGAVAAGGAFPIMGLWPSWSELGADYRTRTGELREFELPGQFHVALGARSSLAVKAGGGRVEQVELMGGEAAFQHAVPAQPVEVVAGVARILLGEGGIETRLRDGLVRVACSQGEAELRHPLGVRRLKAGQQVVCGAGTLGEAEPADLERLSAWRRGLLVFRDTPVVEAIADINRYRAGRVVLIGDSLAARRLSGRFRIDEIDQAVDRIAQALGASVKILPGGVRVLS